MKIAVVSGIHLISMMYRLQKLKTVQPVMTLCFYILRVGVIYCTDIPVIFGCF